MSQLSYTTQQLPAKQPVAKLPSLTGVLYTTIDEYESLLRDRPHFTESLSAMMSTIIAHENHQPNA